MVYNTISDKQLEIFKFIEDDNVYLICDGAIRSGKSTMIAIAYIMWSMKYFNQCTFGISGKTIHSCQRNIIQPLISIKSMRDRYTMKYSSSKNLLTVSKGNITNYYYTFGGRDESSYSLIQGITLSGLMLDEIVLMPESFVEQAIARTLSVDNAKIWMCCNPQSPTHYFYKNFILNKKPKTKYIHFLLSDNPAISEQAIKKANTDYSGIFAKRYIEGLWCIAEGAIYSKFANNSEEWISDYDEKDIIFHHIGVDWGDSGSAWSFVDVGYTANLQKIIVCDEYYTKDEIDGIELGQLFNNFITKRLQIRNNIKPNIVTIYCDSASQTHMRTIKNSIAKLGIYIPIKNAIKGEIIGRISLTNMLFNTHRLSIHPDCIKLIEAFKTAVWNPKATDERLDNGTTNIDSLDSFEYTLEKYQKQLLEIIFRSE